MRTFDETELVNATVCARVNYTSGALRVLGPGLPGQYLPGDDAPTGGLMYLDAYAVATTDLGRGRMESHHYLKEACTIMKPEHGANALARGPPVLTRSGRSGNAAATVGNRMRPDHPSSGRSGVPILPARVQHVDIAGLPGDPPGRPVFVSADRTHPQFTISNNEVKQNASRKD